MERYILRINYVFSNQSIDIFKIIKETPKTYKVSQLENTSCYGSIVFKDSDYVILTDKEKALGIYNRAKEIRKYYEKSSYDLRKNYHNNLEMLLKL